MGAAIVAALALAGFCALVLIIGGAIWVGMHLTISFEPSHSPQDQLRGAKEDIDAIFGSARDGIDEIAERRARNRSGGGSRRNSDFSLRGWSEWE